jgi:hypothetical protein
MCVLALTAVAVTGCGTDRPERADTVSGSETTQTQQPAGTEAPKAAGRTLTDKQAKAALLTVQDLPTGWSVDPDASSDDQGDDDDSRITEPAACADLFDSLDDGKDSVAEATGNYTAGGFGPFLEHTVTSHSKDPADGMDAVTAALSECPKFTMTDADGTKMQMKVSALSFPNLGDRTLALRMSGNSDEIDIVMDLVYIAVGRNGITLGAGGLTPIAGDDLEQLATAAVDKLAAAAKS